MASHLECCIYFYDFDVCSFLVPTVTILLHFLLLMQIIAFLSDFIFNTYSSHYSRLFFACYSNSLTTGAPQLTSLNSWAEISPHVQSKLIHSHILHSSHPYTLHFANCTTVWVFTMIPLLLLHYTSKRNGLLPINQTDFSAFRRLPFKLNHCM